MLLFRVQNDKMFTLETYRKMNVNKDSLKRLHFLVLTI